MATLRIAPGATASTRSRAVIAPDLRNLDPGAEGDEWYIQLTRDGYTQNGVEKMPKFKGVLSQEAMWAIRSWLDTRTATTQSQH